MCGVTPPAGGDVADMESRTPCSYHITHQRSKKAVTPFQYRIELKMAGRRSLPRADRAKCCDLVLQRFSGSSQRRPRGGYFAPIAHRSAMIPLQVSTALGACRSIADRGICGA